MYGTPSADEQPIPGCRVDGPAAKLTGMNQTRTSTNVPINGAVVRHLRIMNGHRGVDLAAILDCSPAYVGQMESGRASRVSSAMFAKLRNALGVTDPRVLMADSSFE